MILLLLSLTTSASPNSVRRALDLPDFEAEAGERHTVRVPMPDGARLHTRVQLPEGDGPWPTLLMRTPYPMEAYLDRICARYVRYGYACVHQTVRGQGKSDGEVWDPFRHERADGLATLDWLIDQPWSSDNIALFGASYMGGVQWAMADALPPEVKTIIPQVFGVGMYDNAYEGGMFRHELLTAWMTLIPDRRFRAFGGRGYQRALQVRPRMEMDHTAVGTEIPWFRQWLASQEKSAALWQSPEVQEADRAPENISVPVLMMGGWHDIFLRTMVDTWERLATQSMSTLVIGPWDHLGRQATDVPMHNVDDDIGLQDSYLQSRRTLDWLDHHLKGRPAAFPVGRALVYTMGADAWQVTETWPPQTTPTTLVAGSGTAQDCTASLGQAAGQPVQFDYRPTDPTPSLGGAGSIAAILSPGFDGVPIGVRDQGALCEERDDLIGWQSAPVSVPTRIAGRIRADLTVSSTAEDTAFNVRILEQTADGRRLHIRESIRALSFREGDMSRVPYTPGQPVPLTIETWPVDYQLQAGSRIVLQLASASFPKYEAHSNTAVYWADAVETVSATQTIHRAAVTLPVVDDGGVSSN